MIGSHNSFTYKISKWRIFDLFSHFWRCLEKSLTLQYNEGVRYFDIRVRKVNKGYLICHGIIDVEFSFYSLVNICIYMGVNFPDSIFRIVLERGDDKDFLREIEYIKDFKNVEEIIIKKPWHTIYKKENSLPIIEYSFEDWTWKNLIKCLYKNLIKNKSKIDILEALNDNTTIHLMD